MAQTTTAAPSRPRGQSSTAQAAPQEAPAGNLPATRPRGQATGQPGAAPANGTRGMTNEQRTQSAMQNLEVVSARFRREVDAWADRLLESIPQSARELAFFKQVLATAAAEQPMLYSADQRTLFNAARKCFLDGCLPDGRDAALVIYNTKIKVRGPDDVDREVSIPAVQYMPMVRGIIRRMLESGLVTSASADAVYSKDDFQHLRGDTPRIIHTTPPLGEDRGKLVGAYAVIRLANGDILRDSMGEKEILLAKAQSRSAKAGASLLWDKFPHEAYKKTVLRRLSKSAPVSPNIHRLVDREDEPLPAELDEHGNAYGGPRYDHTPTAYQVRTPEPEAPVQYHVVTEAEQAPPLDEVTFSIVDLDGVVAPFESPFACFDAVVGVLDQASSLGVARLDGFWESNGDTLDQLTLSGNENLATELAQRFADARDAAEAAEAKRAAEAEAERKRKEAADLAERERQAEQARQRQAEQDAADLEERNRAAREADANVVGARQTQGNALGANDTPAGEEHTSAAPGDGPGDPVHQSAEPQPEPDGRQSLAIAMPLKAGKADYRTWCVALFSPKVRQTTSSRVLGWLIADNAEHYEKCRDPKGPLDGNDRLALIKCVEDQYKKLDPGS